MKLKKYACEIIQGYDIFTFLVLLPVLLSVMTLKIRSYFRSHCPNPHKKPYNEPSEITSITYTD